jgi:mono/diheme cytochrome c family protein
MSRNARPTALGTALLALCSACRFEPPRPVLHFSLNAEEIATQNADLDENLADQEHLLGALEFLFGTPSHPKFLVLPEWADEEVPFDPNYWSVDALASDEESERMAALRASNARAYAAQIAAVRADDFDAVPEPRYAPDLWEDWLALVAERREGSDEERDWVAEGVELFEGYFPLLEVSAELYRQQCYHCHGAEGGGDGSTARFLNPRPRDYRPGIFKFIAEKSKAHPRNEDLFRVLSEGIYTTAMPSFRRFTDAQLWGLADYVKLLSIRGETEILMISDYDSAEGIQPETLLENYRLVVERWRNAQNDFVAYEGEIPESTPERIARGRDLYMDANGANCVKCHGATGRGDGESVKNNPEDATDEWGDPILPRDLTRGLFRFGRRPIDIYRRIYAGINGTPMPEHFGMQITEKDGTKRLLDEDDVWDLVFYVRSLSAAPLHHGAAVPGAAEDAHAPAEHE